MAGDLDGWGLLRDNGWGFPWCSMFFLNSSAKPLINDQWWENHKSKTKSIVQHLPEAMGFYSASTGDSCSISCKSVLGPKIYETSQGWLIIMVHHGPISPILVGISSGSPVKVKFIVVHVTLLLDQGLDVCQRLQKHHISWDTGRFRCSMWSMTTSKGKAPRPKGLKLPIHAWYVSACQSASLHTPRTSLDPGTWEMSTAVWLW